MEQISERNKSYPNKAFEDAPEHLDLNNVENSSEMEEEKKGYANDAEQDNKISTKPSTQAYVFQVWGGINFAAVHLGIGTIIAFTGIMLPNIIQEYTLSTKEISLLSSGFSIGAMIGCCISSAMMTHLGQKSTVLYLLPLGILSWIFLFIAKTKCTLIILKIFQGVVIGTLATCSRNYVGEMAHPSIRGTLSSLVDLFRNLGQVYISVVGSTNLSWRNASLICGISSMLPPFVGILFLPHSPRWLILKGRKDEAHKALAFYRGQNYDIDRELAGIEEDVKKDKSINVIQQMKKLIEPRYLKLVMVLIVLHVLAMFCGNAVVISYSRSIFDLAEIASLSSNLGTILSNVMRIIGLFTFLFISDRFPRKKLTIFSAVLCGICMAILGSFFFLKDTCFDVSNICFVPLISIILFHCFTSITYSNIMILRTELLSTNVRAAGTAFLQTVSFISMFATVYCYPYMIEHMGPYIAFWFYSLCSFLIAVIVLFFVSETKGRSLEEISQSNLK